MKEEILEYFKDINLAYNDCTRFDTLKRMLGELEQELKTDTLDKIRVEICKSKTEHEMQIAERDIKSKLLISDIYCDIVNILDKYKTETE